MNIFKINNNVKLYSFDNSKDFDIKIAELMKNNINKGFCLLPGGISHLTAYQILSKTKKIKSSRKILLTDDRLVDFNSNKSNYSMLMQNLDIDFFDGFPLSYFNEINNDGLTVVNHKIDNILESLEIECSFLGLG